MIAGGERAPRTRPGPVGVVDYGVNNIGSVLNMLRRLEISVIAVHTPEQLQGTSAIVLPGIGAFDAGVDNLKKLGLFDAIAAEVKDERKPILGICLGMQLLTRGSEEGRKEGLALIDGWTKRFVFTPLDREERREEHDEHPRERRLRIPHMGWNDTRCLDEGLFQCLVDPRFYYVHSYHVVVDDPRVVAAECTYGSTFVAALRDGHVAGTQFHPEKSHRYGMRVLSNFARLAGVAAGTA